MYLALFHDYGSDPGYAREPPRDEVSAEDYRRVELPTVLRFDSEVRVAFHGAITSWGRVSSIGFMEQSVGGEAVDWTNLYTATHVEAGDRLALCIREA